MRAPCLINHHFCCTFTYSFWRRILRSNLTRTLFSHGQFLSLSLSLSNFLSPCFSPLLFVISMIAACFSVVLHLRFFLLFSCLLQLRSLRLALARLGHSTSLSARASPQQHSPIVHFRKIQTSRICAMRLRSMNVLESEKTATDEEGHYQRTRSAFGCACQCPCSRSVAAVRFACVVRARCGVRTEKSYSGLESTRVQ